MVLSQIIGKFLLYLLYYIKHTYFIHTYIIYSDNIYVKAITDVTIVTFPSYNSFIQCIRGEKSLNDCLNNNTNTNNNNTNNTNKSGLNQESTSSTTVAALSLFHRKFKAVVEALHKEETKSPNTNSTIWSTTTSSSSSLLLKSGYMLKKRDVFSGWRGRYFEVYYNRIDYFSEEHEIIPR